MQDRIIIEHIVYNHKYLGMVIPFGDYKNATLLEAPIGTICETLDQKNKFVEIVAREKISRTSPVSNALVMMLYGRPMTEISDAIDRNWRGDVFEDEYLFLVVKKVKKMDSKNATFKIIHNFSEEILIPYSAITENTRFIMEKSPIILTADGRYAEVVEKKGLHILSNEAMMLIWRLYSLTLEKYLKVWHERCPDMMSMGFMYMKLKPYHMPIINTKDKEENED